MTHAEPLFIPILSELLGRPMTRGKGLVGLYEPSAQWLSLILTIASGLMRTGYVVGIVTLATPPSLIRKQLAVSVPDLREHEAAGRFKIIDWYTWMTGKKSTEPRSVDTLALAGFNVQDSKFQREDSPLYDFLAADNLAAFLKYNDERAVMQWLDKTMARMRELRGVRLYGFVKRFQSDAFLANLEVMADGIIELDNQEKGGRLENMIRLKGVKGILHSTEWRRLEVTTSGFVELAPLK